MTLRTASDRRSRLFLPAAISYSPNDPPEGRFIFKHFLTLIQKLEIIAGADGKGTLSFEILGTKSRACSINFLQCMFAIEPDLLLTIDNHPQRNKNMHFSNKKRRTDAVRTLYDYGYH